jgi:dimethylhistidine N-methyltransferase
MRPLDFRPGKERFIQEVLSGLQKAQKELPCQYFYDDRGSQLFEHICALEEYYIPSTERSIMEAYVEEMAGLIGPHVSLIEYGCGDCAKVRILLDHLRDPIAYIPIDISQEQLIRVAREVSSDYPELEVLPVCADYTRDFELPVPKGRSNRIAVYFPGATIGNFDPFQTRQFLKHIAAVSRPGGVLLVGIDLKKDPTVLHRAYNDREGITAAFNLNLLRRINHEFNSDFQLDCFQHYAFYNPKESRIEMHLVSQKEQVVHLDSRTISFAKDESIWTESSYKYNLDEFRQIAADAGFRTERVWTDQQGWFSVQYLMNTNGTNS